MSACGQSMRGFLKLLCSQHLYVCVCVCVFVYVYPLLRPLITGTVMRHGMDACNWLDKFYSFLWQL